ncbi:MAG: PilT/PilU family type 4a pilus ATPase [bacterium]|nr:PilT/PilU family type 4a pilus ATPase [bacterium]
MIGRTPENLLKDLFEHVISRNASDLHLSVGRPPVIRIDGKLFSVPEVGVLTKIDLNEVFKAIGGEERAKKFDQGQQEVDFAFAHESGFRFRVNVYLTSQAITIAMRTIPRDIRTLDELSLPHELEQFAKPSQGFVLITGPTGHGKTTTMTAIVNIINRSKVAHVITIEDPVEYVYVEDKCLIHQREIGRDTESFSQALKMAFREDPNVVVVGEMRDLDSIATALTIAETGHMVFATLHTNNSAQTIDRIVDVFPVGQQAQIRTQLAGTLTGIVSQRLVPAKNGGRLPAVELLLATPAVRNLIREGETAQIPGVIQTSASQGMIPLERSLKSLVDQNLVTVEEAMVFASDPSLLGYSDFAMGSSMV